MKQATLLLLVLLCASVAWSTVTTQQYSVTYTCAGGFGPFPFNFPISDPTAITVTLNSVLLQPTSYTVTPVNNDYNNGGSITLGGSFPCTNGLIQVLARVTPITQTIKFYDDMPIPMKTFERSLDKLTEIDQEIWGGTIHSIQVQNNGVDYGVPITGDVNINVATGCTWTGLAPNYTLNCQSAPVTDNLNGCIDPIALGVDNTCGTDTHTALQTAITAAANGCIILPIGCYKTSTTLILPNNITLYGTGSPFASQSTSGANQTVIEQTTNNIPVIDASTATDFTIAHLWVKHTGTAVAGGDGIKGCFTQVCATPRIADVYSAGNYMGFNLGPASHANLSYSAATNNKNHGVVITGTAISNALQWDMQTVNATLNDGIGIVAIASAAAPQNATVGAWNQTSTFGNTGGGISLSGNATRSLSDVSITNCQGDEDGSDEIKVDTYGSKVTIGNCSLEGAGIANTGSGGSTPPSGIGYGINVTAHNQGVALTGNTSSAMSQGGIINAAIGTSIAGGSLIANTGPGYANATGAAHTAISGVVLANNTTYGAFLSVAGTDCLTGNTYYGNVTADISGVPCLTGASSSIGGGALAAGACASTTVSITGANSVMGVVATPATYPGDGNYWVAYVSAANTVTVKVCAAVAGTPTASTYNVRVLQ